MTSTTLTNLGGPQRSQPLVTPVGWVWIALCALVFGWMHWYFIQLTARVSSDPDWSHVSIVPLISLYYLYQHKDQLRAAPKRLFWAALPLVFVGLFSYVWWIYPGRVDMFRGYSMIFTLFAVVLFLLGPAAMRVLWFPIAYLVFAVKISDAIWERIANQLQDVASGGATIVLQVFSVFLDFDVSNNGNTITLGFFRDGLWVSEGMNVAEACAGLRMLMAFVALGVALAFLFDRPWWQRVIMIALAVPIAVAVNIGRVTALGLIYLVDKEYAQGDFHLFVGMLMLIPAAGLFLLVGWVLDRIMIHDDATEQEAAATRAAASAADALPASPAHRRVSAALVLKGLALGAALMLACGLIYAMLFNLAAGRPLFPALGTAGSLVLLILGLVVLGLLAWTLRRVVPGRGGSAALTFGAALIVGLMGVAAAGQHSVITWQKVVLNKERVDLRHDLASLPLDKDGWRFVRDDTLPPEIVEELGTKDYLSRWYEDTKLAEGTPGRVIRLHVAYYTGINDTVPHVPDRCFVAGGVQPVGLYDQPVELDPSVVSKASGGDGGDGDGGYVARAQLPPPGQPRYAQGTLVTVPERVVATKRFTFRPGDAEDQHVSYFFVANGRFLANPNAVRLQGFDIRDTHSYYCKIEIQIVGEHDPDRVAGRTAEVLNTFLPEVLACLPDWGEVKAGTWPRKSATGSPEGSPGSPVAAVAAAGEAAP